MEPKVIWKFELSIENCGELQEVDMPDGALLLSVINQAEKVIVYALVEPEKAARKRKFKVLMTGQTFKPDMNIHFVGTVALDGGAFVVHVFEINKW